MSVLLHSYAYFHFRNSNTEHALSGEKNPNQTKKTPDQNQLDKKAHFLGREYPTKSCFISLSKIAECQELHKEKKSQSRGKGIHHKPFL